MDYKFNGNDFTESHIATLSEKHKAQYADMCLSGIIQESKGQRNIHKINTKDTINTKKEYQDTYRKLVKSMENPDFLIKTMFEQYRLIDISINFCLHDEIKFLAENGADLNSIECFTGNTPLTRLVEYLHTHDRNQVLSTMDVLISHGADINKRNKDDTCISAHLSINHPEYIIDLIDRGLNLSLEDKWTNDPIVVLRDKMPETYLAAKKYIQYLEVSKGVTSSDKPLKINRSI